MNGLGLDGSPSHAVTSPVHMSVSSLGRASLYSWYARTCALRWGTASLILLSRVVAVGIG